MHASDADGDSLTYSVQAMTIDRLAQKAYTLDQQLGLHTYANGSYYTNARGAGEKYLLGNGNVLYFLLPNGALYRWGGSIAKSTLVDTLSPAYYANPALLHNAQTPSLTSISSTSVAATVSGNTLTVTREAGFTGVLCVQVSVSDGSKSDSEIFTVADPFAQKAYDLDQQLGLHTYANGSYYTNARGAGEKYMLGNGNVLYFLLPNGALYRWGGSIAGSTLVATLSPDYYANPALLYNAQSPALAAAAAGRAAAARSRIWRRSTSPAPGRRRRPMRRCVSPTSRWHGWPARTAIGLDTAWSGARRRNRRRAGRCAGGVAPRRSFCRAVAGRFSDAIRKPADDARSSVRAALDRRSRTTPSRTSDRVGFDRLRVRHAHRNALAVGRLAGVSDLRNPQAARESAISSQQSASQSTGTAPRCGGWRRPTGARRGSSSGCRACRPAECD